jgi:hypothetical protein
MDFFNSSYPPHLEYSKIVFDADSKNSMFLFAERKTASMVATGLMDNMDKIELNSMIERYLLSLV